MARRLTHWENKKARGGCRALGRTKEQSAHLGFVIGIEVRDIRSDHLVVRFTCGLEIVATSSELVPRDQFPI
jgi:hypothetical protein